MSRCKRTSQPCPVGSALGERLDNLIVRAVPDVQQGREMEPALLRPRRRGGFLAFRCYTNHIQLQFFRGTSLEPVPPKASKHDEVRYLDIHEDDYVDEAQLVSWIEQASRMPGEEDVEPRFGARRYR